MSLASCENGLRGNDCEGTCHTRCYSCGMAACRPCSVIVTRAMSVGPESEADYYLGRRVCVSCCEDRHIAAPGTSWFDRANDSRPKRRRNHDQTMTS